MRLGLHYYLASRNVSGLHSSLRITTNPGRGSSPSGPFSQPLANAAGTTLVPAGSYRQQPRGCGVFPQFLSPSLNHSSTSWAECRRDYIPNCPSPQILVGPPFASSTTLCDEYRWNYIEQRSGTSSGERTKERFGQSRPEDNFNVRSSWPNPLKRSPA
jgi:hypothetical protein